MNNFKKGDVLIGKDSSRDKAYHPIVFINGTDAVPNAVVITHSNSSPCNVKLLSNYDDDRDSYFVAHLIEKMPEWGPYKKVGMLEEEDMNLIENHISDQAPITWEQYEEYTKGECPDHT